MKPSDGKWVRLPFTTGNMIEQFHKDPAPM